MALTIGDATFLKNGQPAVVVGSNDSQDQVRISTEPEKVKQSHKHGYINGLEGNERARYQALLDEIAPLQAKEKIQRLKSELQELYKKPDQHRLANYVRSELAHIMHSSGIKPKEYSLDSARMP